MSEIQNPKPGLQNIKDGNEHRPRGTRTGELATSEAHGAYHEACRSGNLWMISTPVAGITVTANMLFSVASSNAILGLYNKSQNHYLHITRVNLMVATATAVGLVWAVNTPTNISPVPTGTDGRNLRDFTEGGHQAIAFNGAQAVSGGGVTEYFKPIVNLPTGSGRVLVEEKDVDIMVPPLGFAGVYGDTVTTATVVFGSLTWEEVPV